MVDESSLVAVRDVELPRVIVAFEVEVSPLLPMNRPAVKTLAQFLSEKESRFQTY